MKIRGRFLFGLPMCPLQISDREIECLVDTGFNGQLMLSKTVINELGLEQVGTADYFTADGDSVNTGVYLARMKWFSKEREVLVVATNTDFALLGMGLLHECRAILERRRNILELEE